MCFLAGGALTRRLGVACAWKAPPLGAAAARALPRGAPRRRARLAPSYASGARGPVRAAATARATALSRARIWMKPPTRIYNRTTPTPLFFARKSAM